MQKYWFHKIDWFLNAFAFQNETTHSVLANVCGLFISIASTTQTIFDR